MCLSCEDDVRPSHLGHTVLTRLTLHRSGQDNLQEEDKKMQEYDDVGRRRLSPSAEDDWTAADRATRQRAVGRRDAGVRQTRQVSGWTAAALVAGVAAGAGYFAHAAATPTVLTSGAAVQGAAGSTAQKPSLTHPVVTSGGSGVTVGTSAGSPRPGGGTVQWQDS
jgi:anti-sigma factor RsiW